MPLFTKVSSKFGKYVNKQEERRYNSKENNDEHRQFEKLLGIHILLLFSC
jgi:hypothetical protein